MPNKNLKAVITFYNLHSKDFVHRYESITFDEVHGQILDILPKPPANILDVGAGSGRDSAALARRSYNVTAVEPSNDFRKIGHKLYKNMNITWLDDCLPNLKLVKELKVTFDLILLSAIWMHIHPEERFTSIKTLNELLKPDGFLIVSFRQGGDEKNRLFYPVSSEELTELTKKCGLNIFKELFSKDPFGRSEIKWSTLVYKKSAKALRTIKMPEIEWDSQHERGDAHLGPAG